MSPPNENIKPIPQNSKWDHGEFPFEVNGNTYTVQTSKISQESEADSDKGGLNLFLVKNETRKKWIGSFSKTTSDLIFEEPRPLFFFKNPFWDEALIVLARAVRMPENTWPHMVHLDLFGVDLAKSFK